MEKEMTLAQALKLKNKIVSKINKLTGDIFKYNYDLANKERPIDVRKAMDTRRALVEDLITLKSAINTANVAIQKDIYQLAEYKGWITLYASLRNYDNGRYSSRNEATVEYDFVWTIGELDTLTDLDQGLIDDIQDRIDTFNHTTKITVDLKAV
jgi:hypothetical protein